MNTYSEIGTNKCENTKSEEMPNGCDVKMEGYDSRPNKIALGNGSWGINPDYKEPEIA